MTSVVAMESRPRGGWVLSVGVVAAAGLPGLLLLGIVEPAARYLEMEPGLAEYVGLATASSLVVLGLLLIVVPRAEQQSRRSLVRLWWRLHHPEERVERPMLLWAAAATLGLIGLTSLRLWLIDTGWDLIPGPSWSINSPDANRGALDFDVTAGVFAYQALVRIPLTVFVEESLFRGWLHDRHGPIGSGLLFAIYHLAQWWTIPALVPFGLALSLLRSATRSIWPGAVMHGGGNLVYALSLT